ncbi:MAG: triple tyrosine motif-containing protein, partial [Bacteroidota bacterium]
FRYKLKGLEDHFSEWTNSNIKEYSNLKAGDYEFVVQTRNHLGEVQEDLPFYLEVKPPLYRTLGAKILYALLAILALFGVSKRQKYRYQKQTQKIKAAKELQLSEKEQELIAIEREKEQALRALKEEKMLGELQLVKKQLAASVMNMVAKNEFIETIKEELNNVKEKGKSADMRKSLERIVKDIDSTLRLQEDWEQFQYHFEQVHGDFLSRMTTQFNDLSPNDQKLCAFLRLNLNTKDIANLMGISLRGVEVARYRLRKKLDLQKGQNLAKFILEY